MDALRVIINGFSGAEKQAISTDPDAMAKGRTHLGDLYYMSLLAAVDTNVKKTDKVDSVEEDEAPPDRRRGRRVHQDEHRGLPAPQAVRRGGGRRGQEG